MGHKYIQICKVSDGSVVKNLPANAGDIGLIPESEGPPWKSKWQIHSSILAWKIPWRKESGRLQSMGLPWLSN